MDKLKQWSALTLVLVLAVAAGGWFLLVSPKRAEATDLKTQGDAQEQTNDDLRTQLSVLKNQAKELPKKQAELADFQTKIPATAATPTLIRALTEAATAAGLELISITPGSVSASTNATATGVAGTLLEMPLTLNVVGTYAEVQAFTAKLETLPRSVRVTGVGVVLGVNPAAPASEIKEGSSKDGSSLIDTIDVKVFMASSVPVAPAGAAAAAPPATKSPAQAGVTAATTAPSTSAGSTAVATASPTPAAK